MKFTVSGSRIICSRLDTTIEGNDTYRRVVEFDEHVDKVPPHVTARLTRSEVRELEQILADRRRIQENPAEKNMLEVLPAMLQDATAIINSIGEIDRSMYDQLDASIAQMAAALRTVNPGHSGELTSVDSLPESEAQKARLDSIKHEL